MRRILLIAFLLAFSVAAHAQNLQRALVVSACGLQTLPAGPLTNLTMNPAGQLCIGGSVAPPYVGPGDVVSGAVGWWGLRAYSASYAATPGKAINLRRALDNAACDFNVAANGDLGVSASGCGTGVGLSPAAFATQDATASCTVAAATATCTGASSTPHVGSSINGSGLTQPCWATAVGTFTGGAGTVTVIGGPNAIAAAPCGVVGSSTPFTFTYGLYVSTIYDQSGVNGCAGSACNLIQATAAKQPQLFSSCLSPRPCLSVFRANAQSLIEASGNSSLSSVATANVVLARTSISGFNPLFGVGASPYVGYNSSAGVTFITAGTNVTGPTAADSASHVFQGVFTGSTTSFLSIDGVSGTPGNAGSGSWASNLIGISPSGTFNGYVGEAGLWSSNLSGAQITSMCHNQFNYWGTSTSC